MLQYKHIKIPNGNFFEKNENFWHFFFVEKNENFWHLKKKSQVFGNFLTVKWQFSGGSGHNIGNKHKK